VPRWNTISISGYHMREAGSTAAAGSRLHAVQRHRVRRSGAGRWPGRGRLRPQLSFFFNAHNHLLESGEVPGGAPVVARIMRDRFHARDPRSMMLRFHVQTAGSMPDRPAAGEQHRARDVQALAAVLGGCQSLHTNSMDEALALRPSARSGSRCEPADPRHEFGRRRNGRPLAARSAIERLIRDER